MKKFICAEHPINFKSLATNAEGLKSLQEKIDNELAWGDSEKKYTHTTILVTFIVAIVIIISIFILLIVLFKHLRNFKRICEPGANGNPTVYPIALEMTSTESQPLSTKGTESKYPK